MSIDVEALERIRDLLARYLWDEDDSGDENDLEEAHDELRDALARLVPAKDEGRLREAARAMWYAHTEDERFAGPVSDDPYGDFERALLAPSHPHDGFAYDGCVCVCCANARALATPEPRQDEYPKQHETCFTLGCRLLDPEFAE